jgi:FKBP12-rapamycin complex-associated protein
VAAFRRNSELLRCGLPALPLIVSATSKSGSKDTDASSLQEYLVACARLGADAGLVSPTTQTGVNPFDSSGDALAAELDSASLSATDDQGSFARKLRANELALKRAWEAGQRSTSEDWIEWMRRLSIELLRESPSPALRSCLALAHDYSPLVSALFNAAFLSCWSELPEQYQDELVSALETALTSPSLPSTVLHQLLNLAEFMERAERALPLDIRTLGTLAARGHAYAKSLHYKEVEFLESPESAIEDLITIYHQLQQPDAAVGVLEVAQNTYGIGLREEWFEQLGRFDEALHAYEARLAGENLEQAKQRRFSDPHSVQQSTIGLMRCLRELGEWDRLGSLCATRWPHADEKTAMAMAPLAANAAWHLQDWESLGVYVRALDQGSVDGAFFWAVHSVHSNLFAVADRHISTARGLLDEQIRALIGESYRRAYPVITKAQQLVELQEVIEYKKCSLGLQADEEGERRSLIRSCWDARLLGAQRSVETWQRLLSVRSLVIEPSHDLDIWLQFAALCRKEEKHALAQRQLDRLVADFADDEPLPAALQLTMLRQRWVSGDRWGAVEGLTEFAEHVTVAEPSLVSRVNLYLGEWYLELRMGNRTDGKGRARMLPSMTTLLTYFRAAAEADPSWQRAWHRYALVSFEAISDYTKKTAKISSAAVDPLIVPVIQAFFRSIALSVVSSLQDTLRLLSLWFKYGDRPDVAATLRAGFKYVSIDTWLQVIPQIIARISTAIPGIRKLVKELLIDVGREHPQALVYSLSVASKSQSKARQSAAEEVLRVLRSHSSTLVQQALLVSRELIRVAILWYEMWHEGLEDASRLYYGAHDVDGMFRLLAPLHAMIEEGPTTVRERAFVATHGRDLSDALDWCRKYQRTGRTADLNQAWDIYYHVFHRIHKQLPSLTSLDLARCSPDLLAARGLELVVPGTYVARGRLVRILRFSQHLSVISSKQRPRKLSMSGSDGCEYVFLLKGHEDLRQDERVMQLFGLVNTLVRSDRTTSSDPALMIQRFNAIPLSPKSGLLSWVPEYDTLHGLIREYRDREGRKVPLNIEHRHMTQVAPELDHLTLMQKVEAFEHALANTDGMDLARLLWMKANSTEVWLSRRVTYTRSLAVMSMVGYILGLGDRHPSNLMMSRRTGKILHIDFGDCFEVAMHRDKYPESVPFRLTRMLVRAMEVAGVDGTFRATCHTTMTVLRRNRESLMAVLEAFVHDPLVNWRFAAGEEGGEGTETGSGAASGAGTASGGNGTPRGQQQQEGTRPRRNSRGTRERRPSLSRGSGDGSGRDVGGNVSGRSSGRDDEAGGELGEDGTILSPLTEGAPPPRKVPPRRDSEGTLIEDIDVSADLARAGLAPRVRGGSIAPPLKDHPGPNPFDQPKATGGEADDEDVAGSMPGSSQRRSVAQEDVIELGALSASVSRSVRGSASVVSSNLPVVLNERSMSVISRVNKKLTGRDFKTKEPLSVPEQVDRLIKQATSNENLCSLYVGWCPFW